MVNLSSKNSSITTVDTRSSYPPTPTPTPPLTHPRPTHSPLYTHAPRQLTVSCSRDEKYRRNIMIDWTPGPQE